MKVTKEKATPVCRPSGTLDQPQASGAAQLALTGHTKRALLRSSNSARLPLRLLASDRGGAQGNKKRKHKFKSRCRASAASALNRLKAVVHQIQQPTHSGSSTLEFTGLARLYAQGPVE